MSAKDIILSMVTPAVGNAFIKKHHYSGKVVPNSQIHIGVYTPKKVLAGVMQFGPSINKKGTINLVAGTPWNGFIELNRMAFSDVLGKNTESRAISVALKLIKKNAPHIKWVISFADATECGDGTIYRASGFDLVGIAKNTALRLNPVTGEKMHIIQAHHKMVTDFKTWQPTTGFQLKYIYFLDKSYRDKLTKPILPYSAIKEAGATMYKGVKPQ